MRTQAWKLVNRKAKAKIISFWHYPHKGPGLYSAGVWREQTALSDVASEMCLHQLQIISRGCPFNFVLQPTPMSRRSSVSLVTRLRAGRPELISRQGQGFSLRHRVQTCPGPTQLHNKWSPGALSLGVKRPVCTADHSNSSTAEVKNTWSYTYTPPYVFIALCLIKHRGNFTLSTVVDENTHTQRAMHIPLPPRNRVRVEKLLFAQLLKKFNAASSFYFNISSLRTFTEWK